MSLELCHTKSVSQRTVSSTLSMKLIATLFRLLPHCLNVKRRRPCNRFWKPTVSILEVKPRRVLEPSRLFEAYLMFWCLRVGARPGRPFCELCIVVSVA
ncbi:unnamed protein product [Camellia sinensis]